MKKIKYSLLAFSALLLSLASCQDDDQSYALTGNLPVGSLAIDKTTIDEIDDPATSDYENVAICTFTMDKPYKTNMKFKVEFLADESTGSLEDFEVNLPPSGIDNGTPGFLLTVPANQTSQVFTVTATFDEAADPGQTLKFKIYPIADLNGTVDANSEFFTITVGNNTSDNLEITFDWEAEREYVGINGSTNLFADFDFDLEVYTSVGAIEATSYTSAPEKIEILNNDTADGLYYIVPSFYDASTAVTPMLPISFNTSLKVVKRGVFTKVIELPSMWNSTVGGYEQGNPDYLYLAAYFVKVGNTYTLYDMDDNELATGKMAQLKQALKNNKNKKK